MVVFVDKPAITHPDSTAGVVFLSNYETVSAAQTVLQLWPLQHHDMNQKICVVSLQTNKVPKYDRTFETDPLRLDKSGERVAVPVAANAERRCYNCGSYAHLNLVRSQ